MKLAGASSVRAGAVYAVIAGAVWLGWEIVKAPVVARAPPEIALRLVPGSGEALQRAAEIELQAKRAENALFLSGESLRRAPFNARALRVRGLAEAEAGNEALANELLTLAGNWSLRDDPAHAWLITYRLRRGDYRSAFAHADTLARRRTDLYPQIFNLFTTAAQQDSRALPEVVRLLAAAPPWRLAYWEFLHPRTDGAPVLAGLAIGLQKSVAPLADSELQALYSVWAGQGRIPAMRFVREHIARPPMSKGIQNGDFGVEPDRQILPFGWRLGSAAGMSASLVSDDTREGDNALLITYDGFGSTPFGEQMMLLPPGPQLLTWDIRAEAGGPDLRMNWSIYCIDTGERIASPPLSTAGQAPDRWVSRSYRFAVPPTACTAQRLVLEPRPEEQKTTIIAWVDNVAVRGRSSAASSASP